MLIFSPSFYLDVFVTMILALSRKKKNTHTYLSSSRRLCSPDDLFDAMGTVRQRAPVRRTNLRNITTRVRSVGISKVPSDTRRLSRTNTHGGLDVKGSVRRN